MPIKGDGILSITVMVMRINSMLFYDLNMFVYIYINNKLKKKERRRERKQ